MAVQRIAVEQFLALAAEHPLIDVRSPGEYNHACIPGALSLPLFSDEERKTIGTAYKQQSREAAIKIGLDAFGPKMRKMVEQAEAWTGNHSPDARRSRTVLLYCWRGGMRSGAVAWLLDLYGFTVYTLAGGYKQFRNHVLKTFRLPFPFKILGGYTGSGKTELLQALARHNEVVIDLEGLAQHKGSAFGNIGMPSQPGQEMFENLLAQALRRSVRGDSFLTTWLEDESQRIGLVNIPHELWKTMRQSPVYFLDIPFEERLLHLAREYGQLDPVRMEDAILRISKKLGHLNAKTAIGLLKEGKITESFGILLKYYDKHYFKSLHNREHINTLLHTITCKSVTPENANQLVQHSGLPA